MYCAALRNYNTCTKKTVLHGHIVSIVKLAKNEGNTVVYTEDLTYDSQRGGGDSVDVDDECLEIGKSAN